MVAFNEPPKGNKAGHVPALLLYTLKFEIFAKENAVTFNTKFANCKNLLLSFLYILIK